jgi:hypothetical protein
MEVAGETRITECPDYLLVDFGSADSLEIAETYRQFADLCIGNPVTCALLTTGDNDPAVHRKLDDALVKMASAAAIAPDFKLALVPSTRAIAAVYRETQRRLRIAGLNAWVFETMDEAVEWLEGRAVSGPAAS